MKWYIEPNLSSYSGVLGDSGSFLSLIFMLGQDSLGTRQGSGMVLVMS